MRIVFSIILVIGTGIIMLGCGTIEPQMPDDFSLSFDWNTGALPPEYRYAYLITIGPGTQGEFEYVPGYDSSGESNIWITQFTLSGDALVELYEYLDKHDIFRTRWKTGRGLVGGSTTSLIITAFGKEYHVPSISELEDADKMLIEDVFEEIRGYVPDAIWDEMNNRQTQYGESFTD